MSFMALFVSFVFGAVMLGAGAMLSPAWPTHQPRIGLSASLALALVAGGTIFYASAFGWETLVIGYLLFALLVTIFLGGTLSGAQTRAESRGEELLDGDQGWPGPQDLALLAVLALIFGLPALVLPVPFGTDAQAYGLLALTTREGGTLNTLTPLLPDVETFLSPGFYALTAYFSQQLNAGIHTVQFAVGGVLAFLNVWLAYDFGSELRDKRLGRVMMLVMTLSLGMFGLLLNGQYPMLMGLLFVQAFLLYAVRFLRHQYPADLVGAGLMMGATIITHLDTFVIAVMAFAALAVTVWFARERPSFRAWVMFVLVVPIIAIVATLPWLVDAWPLLTAEYAPLGERAFENFNVMISHSGLWVAVLALGGVWVAWLKRDWLSFTAIAWLILIFDYAVSGGVVAILPAFDGLVSPASIAWAAPIIPFTLLASIALLWLWDNYLESRTTFRMTYRQSYRVSGAAALIVLGIAVFNQPLRGLMLLGVPDAYATQSDVDTLTWIRENTPPETRVIAYPDSAESGWVAVISERASTVYPRIPQAAMPEPEEVSFWRGEDYALNQNDVVFLPQIIANADESAFWRDLDAIQATFDGVRDFSDLTPLHEDGGGAIVYTVTP